MASTPASTSFSPPAAPSAVFSSLLLGQPCSPLTSLPLAGSHVPRQDLSSDTVDTILAWLWLRAPRWGLPLWCPGMPRFTSYTIAGSTDSAATPTALSSLSCSSETLLHQPTRQSQALIFHSLSSSPSLCSQPSARDPSIDHHSSLQSCSHLSLLTLFPPIPPTPGPAPLGLTPSPQAAGAAGEMPPVSLQSQSPRVGCLSRPLHRPPPRSSLTPSRPYLIPAACPPSPQVPQRKQGGPCRRHLSLLPRSPKLPTPQPASSLPSCLGGQGALPETCCLPSGLQILSPPHFQSPANDFLSHQISSFLLALSAFSDVQTYSRPSMALKDMIDGP